MLPPRTAGWTGSAARIACASEAVVVLPLVPVTPDGRRRAQPEEQVRLADQGRDARVPVGPRGDQPLERRAQPRLRGRVVGGDRGRGGHERRVCPRGGRVHVRSEPEDHVPAFQRRDPPLQLRGRPAVIHGDPRPGVGQEPRQGNAAAGKPEHGHRASVQGTGPHAVERQRVEVDRHGVQPSQTSAWIEARNRVTPSRPARMPTIQNRSVIFSSSQPPSSK